MASMQKYSDASVDLKDINEFKELCNKACQNKYEIYHYR